MLIDMEILKIVGGIFVILSFFAFIAAGAYVDITTDKNYKVIKPPFCYFISFEIGLCEK